MPPVTPGVRRMLLSEDARSQPRSALPEVSGLPAAFRAARCTEPVAWMCNSDPAGGSAPPSRPETTASSGWENAALRAGISARRQSPLPQASA